MDDIFEIGGERLKSRLFIGTALYPSPSIMRDAIQESGSEVVTISLRRANANSGGGEKFFKIVKELGVHLLPNTAGCHSAKEAIETAKMAREIFETDWIKLEVIGDEYNLQPDIYESLKASEELNSLGFRVFPYITDDLVVAKSFVDSGCDILMPWGSPIGSGMGLMNEYNLRAIRERFPDIRLLIDAGIGKPSDAVRALELGFDGVLLNSAVALAIDPILMARAFRDAIRSGRSAYLAGMMKKREFASASTPIIGTPFWHQEKS